MWVTDLNGSLVNLSLISAISPVVIKDIPGISVVAIIDPQETPTQTFYSLYRARDKADAAAWISNIQRYLNGLITEMPVARVLH